MTSAISIKNLSYTYPDGTKALTDVNVDISKNESVAIIGQNGSGKTTLLLHLNGIIENGNVSIEILGMSVNKKNIKTIRSKVGVVFQDPDDQLFMPTVFDDVAFGPVNLDLSDGEVRERVNSSLKKVGMLGFEDRFSHHLSFGEKKKISLASVLSMEPEIIVLDEPTANLDPKSRKDLIKIICKLKAEGKTIIISTHDLSAIPELVDRVYVLNKTIIAEGTPRDIFLNTALLEAENLDIPDISVIFNLLSCFGYDPKNLPLSIDDAIEHLTKTSETGEGHIHLHFHEHTHDRLEEFRKKHGHHNAE
jgi:cobalt/nickel transport system ATP-binding protein